jgi:hypothetical protein
MKFGFICPQVPGHLNEITALAHHVQMRGHDVVFLYSSGVSILTLCRRRESNPHFSRRGGWRSLQ